MKAIIMTFSRENRRIRELPTLFMENWNGVSGCVLCHPYLQLIAKVAAQPDRIEGFLRALLAATLGLVSAHGAQLRWKELITGG